MKKYLVLFFLLASLTSFGQFVNYTNINGRYKWIAGKFDSTFTIPSGTTPSLRTGGGTGPGALFYRTTDSTVYQYTGTQWIKLRAGVSPTDTAGIWLTNVYRKPGSDSVFYVKGGSSTFAFRDSVGNVGGGGGGGKIYYFNGGVNMGTFGGLTMYELGDTAVTGSAANFTRATTGAIANFITDVNKPGLLQIPAGVWTIDAYVSETGGGANHAQIWAVLEKWNGSTITTIATSPIEEITNGSVIDLYTWTISVPTTSISVTDRIIIQFYITNTNGKTVTLYTQNGYVGEVHTTFTTGIGSLNGLTAPSQFFATGTSGTDFNIASATATHTFNLPTASATNRGALSSADWTTFNSKVGGSGTTNYLSKWTSSSALGNSLVFDNGTNVGIGTTSPAYKLDVSGTARFTQTTYITGGGLQVLGGMSSPTGNGGFELEYSAGIAYITAYNRTSFSWVPIDIRSSQTTFSTSGTEKMRLTSSGRLLIGTTTESTYELDVVGDIRSTLDANINGLTVGKGAGNLSENTAVGFASQSNNIGNRNTSLGYQSLSHTSGFTNTTQAVFIGYQSGLNINGGNQTTAIGVFTAGVGGLSGIDNTMVGYASGYNLSTGQYNTFYGSRAGFGITTGQFNIHISASPFGTNTGITTGSFNTIIGSQITGLSASLSNTIILADGQGNQRLYINNTGLTGLGITSPANALHIDRGNATASYLQFTAGTTTGQTATDGFEVGIDASGNGVLNQQENLPMLFYTNNTERMRVLADGAVLINATSGNGGVKLYTSNGAEGFPVTTGTTQTFGALRVRGGGNGVLDFGVNSSQTWLQATDATDLSQRYFIFLNPNGGNVGVNSTTPRTFSSGGGLYIDNATYATLKLVKTGYTNGFDIQFGGTAESYIYNRENGFIAFGTNNSERMRLTAAGRLLLGTSTESTYLLDINGTARVQGTAVFQTANNTSSIQDLVGATTFAALYLDQATPSLTNYALISDGSVLGINTPTGAISFRHANTSAINISGTGAGTPILMQFIDAVSGGSSTPGSTNNLSLSLYGGRTSNAYGFGVSSNLMEIQGNTDIAFFTGNSTSRTERLRIKQDGSMGLGTSSPNASALLDVSSTTKGFLPPRMTNAQMVTIATPAAGLVVYDTTNNKLNVYDGTNWVTLH